jgi:CRISPR/Cas system-associated exonuclease Cas4 (RecB family)
MMKPFLLELAETLFREHTRKLDTLTLVFPNRRASLYFRKHLSTLIDKPVFAPDLITIEEFIGRFSSARIPDKLELIYQLWIVYHAGKPEEEREPFDQFYFWGEMLLKDFDEIDKYMVNSDHLFKDLSNQKELDATFDFLTEEHREFLRSFWINFQESPSGNKEKFLSVWKMLPGIYAAFRKHLEENRLAYDGMLHRNVAEKIASQKIPQGLKFVGFNALTKAEEVILAACVEKAGATIHWDVDTYYVNNVVQEAGRFFREYQEHPILKSTFPAEIPSNLINRAPGHEKKIRLYGAPQPIGQAKLAAQLLKEEIDKGINPEETLFVLPDEKLLMPVMHGVSGHVDKLNVTMGFPLSATPMFNLIELLVELQITRKSGHFNHRSVLAILGHPYVVVADTASSHKKRKDILIGNWVHIPKNFLASSIQLHRIIFQEVGLAGDDGNKLSMIEYIRQIITEIGSLNALPDFDKEYAFGFLTLINRFDQVIGQTDIKAATYSAMKNSWRSFLRLFRQVVRSYKIPFSGEPLRGLQVMGVLETRNLDYKNVIILSLNEGAFPSFSSKGSYIPFNIRKAYRLPTVEHQDAMYAYLFYRVLQRAENISLFYNSETDVLGQGEMSRYLQQLIYESGLPVERAVMHHTVQPLPINPITIKKDKQVLARLADILKERPHRNRGLSPSALNAYIECRLRFYFRYVAGIKEPNEVEDDLDARMLGSFLHQVMERFYKQIRDRKKSKTVDAVDFENYLGPIHTIIDDVFRDWYKLDPAVPVEYDGQRLVVREMIIRFASKILDLDKKHAPFEMEALEQEGMVYSIPISHAPGNVVIGGVIDRADYKDGVLRIIDYKTGKDDLDFLSIASLFQREGKRNKAVFQTLVYALLVRKNFPKNYKTLLPGLMNRKNLFDDNFTFGFRMDKELLSDVISFLDEFEELLKNVVEELYDPKEVFDQTTEEGNCKFCPYNSICYR